jgi:hypothetical protein
MDAYDVNPLDDASGQFKLERMYAAKNGLNTEIGKTTIKDTAVLRKGYYDAVNDKGFGWEKIHGKHGNDIKTALGLPDDDISIKDAIGKTLKEGTPKPNDKWVIQKEFTNPQNGDRYHLRVVLSNIPDEAGSITDAYPDRIPG